ncbi:MAG: EmrB/QacA family drug resistance transporter, partial [Acidobacteria bacterium]
LPHIAATMSATIDEATWVLTSYLVANAIILPMTGWLAATFGRKRLLMMSVTGFTVSSFLCGIAPNLGSLIAFRILQGATGGALQPLSQAVLLESFEPHERGKAMGFWGLGIVVAPILGPVVGGWLTDSYSWRWVFYINLPVGVASIVMTKLFIFDPPYLRRETERIDYWGIGMLVVGIGALQYVLDKGQEADWFADRSILTLSIISAVTLIILIIHEWTTEHPIIDLRVCFVLYGSMVLLPIMLQTLLGYPSMQAGIAMAPRGVGSLIFMPLVGFMTSKIDVRKLLACGFCVAGLTLIWLGSLNLNAGYWDIFWPQFLQGTGMALTFVPLTTATMQSIQPQRMGNATSLFNLMRNIGGSVGIAVTGTMLTRQRQTVGAVLGENINVYDPQTQTILAQMKAGFMARGADAVTATERAYAALHGLLLQHASMVSFVWLFRLLGGIFLALLPLILIMRRPKGRTAAAAAH